MAAKLAPLIGRAASRSCWRKLTDRKTRLRLPQAQARPARAATRVEKLEIEGIGTVTEPRRTLPAGRAGLAAAGQRWAPTATGLAGLEQSQEARCTATDGERRMVKDAIGKPVSIVETSAPSAGRRTSPDARRGDPGAHRGGAGRGGRRRTSPKGATALVMDPRNGEVLALANWPRVDANDVGGAAGLRAPEPRRGRQPTSRARPSRPSRWPARSRRSSIDARARRSTCRRRSRWPTATIKEAHARGAVTLTVARDPRPVLQRGLGEDRPAARAPSGSTTGCAGSASAGRTGVDLPGRGRPASCRSPSDYSGSSMGNLPIGQGIAVTPMQMATAYSAIANGGVAAPAAHRRGRTTASGAAGVLVDAHRRRRSRRCSRACSRPGGTAQRGHGHGLPAGGQDRHRARRPTGCGGYSKTKFVASFIGYAPARDPRLLVAVMVDEPQGDYLRRRGGGPGLRADRGVRAAVPAHPART